MMNPKLRLYIFAFHMSLGRQLRNKIPTNLIFTALLVFAPLSMPGKGDTLTKSDGIKFRFKKPKRLVLIGDLHGDADAYLSLLEGVGAIDPLGRWIGGDTVIRKLGDEVRRGQHSRFIMELDMYLRSQGANIGTLMANGEFDLAMGRFDRFSFEELGQYVGKNFQFDLNDPKSMRSLINKTKGEEARVRDYLRKRIIKDVIQAITNEDSLIVEEWNKRNTIEIWGKVLIVHGGIHSAILTDSGKSHRIGPINTKMRQLMVKMRRQTVKKGSASSYHWLLNEKTGFIYHRGLNHYAKEYRGPDCLPLKRTELEKIMKILGVEVIVTAHRPTPNFKIRSSYNGLVYHIDTGLSSEVGGKLYALIVDEDGTIRSSDQISRKKGPHPTRLLLEESLRIGGEPAVNLPKTLSLVKTFMEKNSCRKLLGMAGKKKSSKR